MPLILDEYHSHHPRQVNADAVSLGKLAAGPSQPSARARIRLVPSKPLRQRTASTATNPFAGYNLHQANPAMQQANDHAYYLSQFADPLSDEQFTEDRVRREFAAEELARLQHRLGDVDYYPTNTSKGSYYSTETSDTAEEPGAAFRDYQQAFNDFQQPAGTTHVRSIAAIREAHGYDCPCKRCRYYRTLSTFPAPYRRELERRELKRLELKEEKRRRRYEMEFQAMEMKRAVRMH